MKPGRELDIEVARAIGFTDIGEGDVISLSGLHPETKERWPILNFSTDIAAAWQAWEWLEDNHPWERVESKLVLGKCEGAPSTILIEDTDFTMPTYTDWINNTYPHFYYKAQQFYISGETYPHAICLAVLEASKRK